MKYRVIITFKGGRTSDDKGMVGADCTAGAYTWSK